MAFQIIFVISFGKQKYRVAVRVPIYWVTSQTPVVLRAGPGMQAGSPTREPGSELFGPGTQARSAAQEPGIQLFEPYPLLPR